MTLPDLGPERPGPASSTRAMVERAGTEETMSARSFWIALGVILVAISFFALLLVAM